MEGFSEEEEEEEGAFVLNSKDGWWFGRWMGALDGLVGDRRSRWEASGTEVYRIHYSSVQHGRISHTQCWVKEASCWRGSIAGFHFIKCFKKGKLNYSNYRLTFSGKRIQGKQGSRYHESPVEFLCLAGRKHCGLSVDPGSNYTGAYSLIIHLSLQVWPTHFSIFMLYLMEAPTTSSIHGLSKVKHLCIPYCLEEGCHLWNLVHLGSSWPYLTDGLKKTYDFLNYLYFHVAWWDWYSLVAIYIVSGTSMLYLIIKNGLKKKQVWPESVRLDKKAPEGLSGKWGWGLGWKDGCLECQAGEHGWVWKAMGAACQQERRRREKGLSGKCLRASWAGLVWGACHDVVSQEVMVGVTLIPHLVPV